MKMNNTVTATATAAATVNTRTIQRYRLWTERPLEERVHVQGVPGGDPSLFAANSNSSIPLLQLWKSSGYIPKPFRFRYSEFPSWEDDDVDAGGGADHVVQVHHDHDGEDNQAAKRQKLTPPPVVEDKPLSLPRPPPPSLPPPPPPAAASVDTQGHVSVLDKIHEAHSERPIPNSELPKPKDPVEDLSNSIPEVKETGIAGNVETVIPSGSGHCNGETKSDFSAGYQKGISTSLSVDINLEGVKHSTECVLSPIQEGRNSKMNDAAANSTPPLELDGQVSDKGLEAPSGSQCDKNKEIADYPRDPKLECEGSEASKEVQKTPCESKEVGRVAGQTSRLNVGSLPPPSSHHKKVSVGKSSFAAPAIVFSRSSLSDKSRAGSSQTPSLVAKRSTSSSNTKTKKENLPTDLEKKQERPNSASKDNSKPCISSALKASQPNKTVNSTILRHNTSVGKESLRQSSLKASSVETTLVTSDVSEPAGTPQAEDNVSGQQKNNASGVQQRGEKVPQSNMPPLSKSTQSAMSHSPVSTNCPPGLSDEELALLLHQELNSSPRVPRVPRVRHAGSLPQLSSAAATNMLTKRTSSTGGKDHNTFSRRKSKDGSRNSHEQDSKVRKVDRTPSSSDSLNKSDVSGQAEGSNDSSVKKKGEKISTLAADSGSFSADADDTSNSSAQLNNAEDGTSTKKGPGQTYLTLPGLIAEIMGTGKRRTYEELCNAVLPHWPNLRKHNGERYAYSSHSQGVLDCLRNRTEWSRLVDRGPKTSSSRKKRKVDAEPPNTESEDGEDRNTRVGDGKSFESNKEEFPRGRRQARKRRRLVPQGRGVKDGHKRRKSEAGSDDSGSFTDSSEESVSSEDDSRESGMGATRSEVSASSHEVGARP